MSTSIDQAFVKQFEREVHEAYQRTGSRLRPYVRTKTNVKGVSTVFQKVGRGVAMTKSRNGAVPVMNIEHSTVECVLSDYYAGDWVDKLDEMKVDHDERAVIANAGAYALGRKTDELIITELNRTTNVAGLDTDGMHREKIQAGLEILGRNDIPDDGNRVCVVGFKQWSALLQMQEFASATYIGPDDLPWAKGGTVRKWLGVTWIAHPGLPLVNNVRRCILFHRNAVAHAAGAEITTDITWHGDRAAHFVNSMMSQGAVLVDMSAALALRCRE